MRFSTFRSRSVCLFLSFFFFISITQAAEPPTIERLSLFIKQGQSTFENQRFPKITSTLPTGLEQTFTATNLADGGYTWQWVFHNATLNPITQLQITGFIDPDLSTPLNTFFNETGQRNNLTVPLGAIAPEHWEISEPGYLTGDLILRSSLGQLKDTRATVADDVALALALPVIDLKPNQELTVTASWNKDITKGLVQTDAHSQENYSFLLYAQLSEAVDQVVAVDYKITKTALTPEVGVGNEVYYLIELENLGPEKGSGVLLTADMPSTLNNITWQCSASAQASCGLVNNGTGSINLSATSLPVGEKITVLVKGETTALGDLINTATIKPLNPDTLDTNKNNNQAEAKVLVTDNPSSGTGSTQYADLAITKTVDKSYLRMNEMVTYHIVAKNLGNTTAQAARILDVVPNSITQVQWTCAVKNGAQCNPNKGVGNLISPSLVMPVNSEVELTITGLPVSFDEIKNTASITSELPDPNKANNHSSAAMQVVNIAQVPINHPLALIVLSFIILIVVGLYFKRVAKHHHLLLMLLVLLVLPTWSNKAEAIFNNGDFEKNSFESWEGFNAKTLGLTGTPPFNYSNINTTTGGSDLRVLVGRTFDPLAPHLDLPRQGNYTAKLNNDQGDNDLNGIRQKDIISEVDRDPSDGKLHIRFSYAAVLDDPQHEPHEQPFFHVLLKDTTDNKVLYDDFAYASQPGRLYYRIGEWVSTPFIDVDIEVPEISLGHEVEVQVLVADCALNAHGGYVYIDAFGSLKAIPQKACINDLKVRNKPQQVQLTWIPTGAEGGYAIYRANDLKGPYVKIATTTSTYATWLDKTVQAGSIYYYTVRPLDALGNEICTSGEIVGTPLPQWELGKPLKRPPYFTTSPIITSDLNTTYNYDFNVVDADNDNLTYTLAYSPVGMTLNNQTGQLNWQPTETGIYSVNLMVADGTGLMTNQTFSIQVTNGNQAPKITNPLPTKIVIGSPFVHYLKAVDPESDPIFYSIGSQADGLKLDQTGRFDWANPILGRYPVNIVVADSKGEKTRQSLVIEVVAAPIITSIPIVKVLVGTAYTYQVKAEDKDTDASLLTYTLIRGPNGMTMDQKGLIQWTPTIPVAPYPVMIQVKDNQGNITTQDYVVTANTQPNNAPVILTRTPTNTASYPNTYTFYFRATDSDDDRVVWSLKTSPSGMSIKPASGVLTWTPDAQTHGIIPVEVQVSDQRGGIDVVSYTITVP